MALRVAVTGASGFLGRALVHALEGRGDTVLRLVRREAGAGEAAWDPERGTLDAAALEGLDAVVHLAGEGIADGRWTAARKARIRNSRVLGTRLLSGALAECARPPAVLVSGSAMGIYGDRGDELLTESSALGSGFLAETGALWEAAAEPARAAGIRVVHPRFGMILHPGGGALARMLPPFRLGAGGPLGHGRQWVSWLSLDDAVAVILFAIATPALSGACNAASPVPVTNAEFARTLGAALHRPAVIPVPALALRLMFGEMADQALLASQRLVPAALETVGYRFRDRELAPTLQRLLDGPG